MPYSKDGPQKNTKKKIFSPKKKNHKIKNFFYGTQKYFLTTKKKISQNQEKNFWDQKKSWDEKKKKILQVGQKNFLDRENFLDFFRWVTKKKVGIFFLIAAMVSAV